MTRSSACFPMNIFSKDSFSNFFQKLNSFIRFLMVMVWVFVLQSLARKLRPSPFFLSSTIYHILAMLSAKTEEIISKFKSFIFIINLSRTAISEGTKRKSLPINFCHLIAVKSNLALIFLRVR